MVREDLIRSLKSQSTWRLFALGLVTYGVYYAHYITRQTRLINLQLAAGTKISSTFVSAVMVLSYLTPALFLSSLFVEDGHPLVIGSRVLDYAWLAMIIAWGFYARNRMNQLNSATSENPCWFGGVWTFLFSPLYFNYKINVLSSGDQAQRIAA